MIKCEFVRVYSLENNKNKKMFIFFNILARNIDTKTGLLSPYRVLCRNIWLLCCLWLLFSFLSLLFIIFEVFLNNNVNKKHINGYLIHFSLEYIIFGICWLYSILLPLSMNHNGLIQLNSDFKQKLFHYSKMDESLIQSYLQNLVEQSPFSLILFQPNLRRSAIVTILIILCALFLLIGICAKKFF